MVNSFDHDLFEFNNEVFKVFTASVCVLARTTPLVNVYNVTQKINIKGIIDCLFKKLTDFRNL